MWTLLSLRCKRFTGTYLRSLLSCVVPCMFSFTHTKVRALLCCTANAKPLSLCFEVLNRFLCDGAVGFECTRMLCLQKIFQSFSDSPATKLMTIFLCLFFFSSFLCFGLPRLVWLRNGTEKLLLWIIFSTKLYRCWDEHHTDHHVWANAKLNKSRHTLHYNVTKYNPNLTLITA